MRQTLLPTAEASVSQEVHRCGECALASEIRRVRRGAKHGQNLKEVVKCLDLDNQYLPDSLRGCNIAARRFACLKFKPKERKKSA